MIPFETGTFAVAVVLGLCSRLLRRRAPRVAAVGVGLMMVFGMITVTELVLRALGAGGSVTHTDYPGSYYGVNAHGLVTPLPGAHRVVEKLIHDDSIIYDVTYTVDEYGRRVVPGSDGPRSSYAIFVGDSFTYGVGVHDHETLPAAFARHHPAARVYNYSFHGSGPFDVLACLETEDFAAEIAETTGIVVYTFIDEHVLRTRDFILGASYRGKRAVYEMEADGGLVRCGTWDTCHPWRHRFMRYLNGSRLRALTGFEMPLTADDFERTARAISQMKLMTQKRLRHGQLLVVFYPGCHLAPRLIPLLTDRRIRFLDLSGAFDGISPPHVLHIYNRHPNADAYDRVASSIFIATTQRVATQ